MSLRLLSSTESSGQSKNGKKALRVISVNMIKTVTILENGRKVLKRSTVVEFT